VKLFRRRSKERRALSKARAAKKADHVYGVHEDYGRPLTDVPGKAQYPPEDNY
jgi:hypothetical protein